MTKKCMILIAAGLPLTAVCALFSNGAALAVFLIYNALMLGLYCADIFLSKADGFLAITRDSNDILYFKSDNNIEFMVKNNFSKPLNIELKDELPDWHFKILSEDMVKTVEPNESIKFSYTAVPEKRGSYFFPNVYIRYDGVLGLCRKYFTASAPMDYKVYPNLRDLSKYRLIIRKHRLLSQGRRRIPLRGQGSEFESLRDYVEGDDYRKVNWMATARENRLIINQYEAEKNQPVYILIDTGRSMSYSIRGNKKLDYSINAALILSDIVNQKGDNSGLMVFNTDVTGIIPPGKGEAHRNALMNALYHVEESNMPSDYAGAFFELIAAQKRRSIVFIFTDFETTEEAKELLSAMPVLSKRHVPVIVLMVNESLEKIADNSPQTKQGIYNGAIAESLITERKKIIRSLNQRGVICAESHSENFALDTINQYLMLKERFFR